MIFLGLLSNTIHTSTDGSDIGDCGKFSAPCKSLKKAIEVVMNEGTIKIDGGTGIAEFNETNIHINKNITMEGFNGRPIIAAWDYHKVFILQKAVVLFRSIDFIRRVSKASPENYSEYSPAVNAVNSRLYLYNCTFQKVSSAIGALNSSVVIKRSCFEQVSYPLYTSCNTSCIILVSDTQFTHPYIAAILKGSVGSTAAFFDRNIFEGKHGYSQLGIILIDDVENAKPYRWFLSIDWCRVTYFRNGLNIISAKQTFVFINNTVFDNNGFLPLLDSVNSLQNYRNSAGSAVSITQEKREGNWKYTIIVENCTFNHNKALSGGAIRIVGYNISFHVRKSSFVRNSAFNAGGAIWVVGRVRVQVFACTFEGNCLSFQRESYGGAIFAFHVDTMPHDSRNKENYMHIVNTTFRNNSAITEGETILSTFPLSMINGSVESQKRSNINSMPRTLITGLNGCILKNLLINVTASADSQIAISCPMSSYQSSKNVIYKSTRFICPAGKTVLISPDSNNTKKNSYSSDYFSFSCRTCPPNYYILDDVYKFGAKMQSRCIPCHAGAECNMGIIRAKDNFWGYFDPMNKMKFIKLPKDYGCTGEECVTFNSCSKFRKGRLCATCERGYSESTMSAHCINNAKCNRTNFWLVGTLVYTFYLLFFLFKMEVVAFAKSQIALLKQLFITVNEDKMPIIAREEPHVDARLETPNRRAKELVRHDQRVPTRATEVSLVYLVNRSTNDNSETRLQSDLSPFECNDSGAENFPRENDDSNTFAGFLKIIFYFYQIEHILKTYGINEKLDAFKVLRGYARGLFSFEILSTAKESFSCALLHLTPSLKMTLKLIFNVSIITVFAGIIAVLSLFGFILKSSRTLDSELRHEKFKSRVILTLFEVVLLSYAGVTNSLLSLITCVEVGKKQYLYIQGDIQCFNVWQYVLIIIVISWVAPFCVFVFCLPSLLKRQILGHRGVFLGFAFPLPCLFYAAFHAFHLKSNHQENVPAHLNAKEVANRMLSMITGCFRKDSIQQRHWEGVYIIRRLIIVVVSAFVQDQICKTFVILTICVLFLMHHTYIKPFKTKWLNLLESFSLLAHIFIAAANVYNVYNQVHGINGEKGAEDNILKISWWFQTVLVLIVPLTLALIVALLIIIRFCYILHRFTIMYIYYKIKQSRLFLRKDPTSDLS